MKFNVKFPAEQRSGPQLQVCWKNLKSAAKKEFAKRRRSKLVTGGGDGEPEPDSLIQKVASIVPSQIHPLPNSFDSDAPLDLCIHGPSDADTSDSESTHTTLEHTNPGTEFEILEDPPEENEGDAEEELVVREELSAQTSAKDRSYANADANNSEYHRARMQQVRLEMRIA
jgi:hypothetical protein